MTFAAAEGLVRLMGGNALPMIGLFEQTDAGTIQLQPGLAMNVSRRGAAPWRLSVDDDGFRSGDHDSRWLAVGDSQVMGSGVAGDQTFSALATVNGQNVLNGGVPGYGVQDAIERAERALRIRELDGVIVFVNQMNDWEEVRDPVDVRYVVRGGWLLKPVDANSIRGVFLASPLAKSHLFFLLAQIALRDWSPPPPKPPEWMLHPLAQRDLTVTIARQIHAFAARNPSLTVLPVYLPADLYAAEGRLGESPLTPHVDALTTPPWKDHRLRDALLQTLVGLDPLDLSDTLAGRTDAFLTQDYHLSPTGHALVARAIEQRISAR